MIALVLFAIAIGIAVLRIVLGPSMPDRVLVLDVIGVNLLSSIAVISILMNTKVLLEVILIAGILSFIGTIHTQSSSRRVLSLNVSVIGEFIGALLILTGATKSVISVFGFIRLPDVYTRSHAATKNTCSAI
jgi:multicomponent Na+:H+ antiporter subunit F